MTAPLDKHHQRKNDLLLLPASENQRTGLTLYLSFSLKPLYPQLIKPPSDQRAGKRSAWSAWSSRWLTKWWAPLSWKNSWKGCSREGRSLLTLFLTLQLNQEEVKRTANHRTDPSLWCRMLKSLATGQAVTGWPKWLLPRPPITHQRRLAHLWPSNVRSSLPTQTLRRNPSWRVHTEDSRIMVSLCLTPWKLLPLRSRLRVYLALDFSQNSISHEIIKGQTL